MASTLPPGHPEAPRNVAVELRFTSGDFEQGFYVFLQIYNNGMPTGPAKQYQLPPNPELRNYYRQWAEQYERLGHQWRDIGSVPGQKTNHASYNDYRGYEQSLKDNLKQWFKHAQFDNLSARIEGRPLVHQDPSVPIIFNFVTPDRKVNNFLRKIPWHLWPLFKTLGQAEVALSIGHKPQPTVLRNPVRILAVFGGEKEYSETNPQVALKLEEDKAALEEILHSKNATVEIIEQPTTQTLHRYLRDERGWDIFFFTGHSTSTTNDGRLLINENHSISLEALEEDFREALRNGLKLAIFNSCRGLGIADFFAGWSDDFRFGNLSIPNLVVMREAVPDFVARHFFKVFLKQFVNGAPIYKAIRYARGNLRFLEDSETPYPCPAWVPVIALSPSWPELYWPKPDPKPEPELDPKPEPEPDPKPGPEPDPELEPVSVSGLEPGLAEEQSINWKKWLSVIAGIAIVLVLGYCARPYFNQDKRDGIDATLVSSEKLISAGGNLALEGSDPLTGEFAKLKEKGIKAFAVGSYQDAFDAFSEIRTKAKEQRETSIKGTQEYEAATKALRDPEVLIYQNNAQVRLNQQAGEPIYTIAAAIPLTDNQGEFFNVGQQMLFGIAQAQDKVVKGDGYERKNLEVVIANDRNDPNQAAALAKSLAEEEDILAIVGHYLSSSTCKALQDAYVDAELTVISPLSTATDIRRDCGFSTQFFRTTSSTRVEAETLVNYLVKEKGNTDLSVGIFYRQEDKFSNSLFQEFLLELNERDIESVKNFKLGYEGFNPDDALSGIQDVDALIVIPDGRNSGSEAFDQALAVIKASTEDQIILASNPLYNQEIIGPAGGIDALKGRLMTANDWLQACAPQDFVKETEEEYWLGGVNRTTILSYEAVEALIPTLEDGVTSREIGDQLNSSTNPPQSSAFRNGKTISFRDGDRTEIQERIIATIGDDSGNPFVVVGDCP